MIAAFVGRCSRYSMKRIFFLLCWALLGPLNSPAENDGSLTPEQALAAFHLEPGLQIELIAAEPLVVDPVAMAFDERGRLFVAENRGYPTGPGPGKPPAGIIAMLEDTDGD